MHVQVCFKHKKVNEGNEWKDKPDLSTYMLWLKRPVLCKRCDKCDEEQNVIDTINALREQEVD